MNEFDAMRRFIKGFITTVMVLIIIIIVTAVGTVIFIGKEVNEKGLKGVIERVWYGKTNP